MKPPNAIIKHRIATVLYAERGFWGKSIGGSAASRLREFLESPCSVLIDGALATELELDSVADRSFADVLLAPDMIFG